MNSVRFYILDLSVMSIGCLFDVLGLLKLDDAMSLLAENGLEAADGSFGLASYLLVFGIPLTTAGLYKLLRSFY